jgi:trans-2,3-dihydro-3-hydroxyanthranilate isomerase
MKQINPVFGRTLSAEQLSEVLGVSPAYMDHGFPIQEVSTGIGFMIVPMKALKALEDICVDLRAYDRLVQDTDAKAILAFCPETYDARDDLCARVFAHHYGVSEDPATGSANGCLTAYLVRQRYFGTDSVNVRVEQGYQIGRPSLLLLRGEVQGNGIDVNVGGRVIMVAKATLL